MAWRAPRVTQVAQRYLVRQCELAGKHVEAELERRSSWVVGAQRVLRWTGTVKHGPRSLSVLDAFVADTVATSKFSGGRLGGWVIADIHRQAVRPAMQVLTATATAAPRLGAGADESSAAAQGESAEGSDSASGAPALLAAGGHRRETTWLNYTTLTYTSELCLEIVPRDDAPGGMPRVRFSLMRHMCP